MFARDPSQIFVREIQQVPELVHPVVVDFTGLAFDDGVVQEPLRFLSVTPGDIQRMFQGGLVFKCRVLFHGSIVVSFPGRFQCIGRENAATPGQTGGSAAR